MDTRTRTGLDIALRGVAFLGGQWVFAKAWDALAPDPAGVDIGAGLAGFGLVVLAALVWGAVDGLHRDVGRLALTWVGAGLVCGAFLGVLLGVQRDGTDLGTLLVELAVLVPFMTALVAVPAVVAGSVTFGLWRRVPAGD
jgi:hypothetical protein